MDIQKWKKKKEKAQLEGNVDSVYFACKELAELYFGSEQFDLALKEYKEMERMSEISGNLLDVGRAHRMIGEVYCEKGEFEKAVKHQRKHLVISRDEHNKVEEQRALATLGRTYFLQAESIADPSSAVRETALGEAKKYYIESLAICNELTDSEVGSKQRAEMIARLFLNIGLVLDCQNDYETAITYMNKAVSICKKLDLWEDLYRTYSALGAAYQKHNDKNQAIKTYDLGLSVAERLSNKAQLMCEILLLKADVLLDLPDVRGARQVLLKAYKLKASSKLTRDEVERKLRIVATMCECEGKLSELLPDVDDSERKKLYEEMGDAAAELNNFKLALTYYHLMLECVEKCGSERKALIDSYISLAQTYKDNLQLSKALEYFLKELNLEEEQSPEACKTLLNVAEVYQLMGKRTEMYEALEQANIGSMRSTDLKLKKAVLTSLHLAFVEDNKVGQAEVIKRELNSIDSEMLDDSFEEDSEPQREFGAHISLDNLTDDEGGSGQGGEEKAKQTRTRAKRGGILEKRNEKGETPLHVAAIQGNVSLASRLLEQGHRIDLRDYSGWTPLHEACNHGHTEVVKVLLEHGAPVNDRGGPHCDGVTPLLDAASNGNLDIVELLLSYGASPLMRTNSGETVIDCLSGWRRRRYEELGADLDSSLLAHYASVYRKVGKFLENAGQKLSSENESPKKLNEITNKARLKKPEAQKPTRLYGSQKKVFESSTKATNEYENAMKALRHRSSSNDETGGFAVKPLPSRALLSCEEQVGDDWLEDDLELSRPQKKRRTGDQCELIGRRSREGGVCGGRLRPVSPILPSSPSSTDNELEMTIRVESPKKQMTQNNSEPSSPLQGEASSSQSPVRIAESSGLKRKQPSLTQLGVIKRRSLGEERTENITLPSQVSSQNITPKKLTPPKTSEQTYTCLKVSIEGKTVIVPVPGGGEGLHISWLAEEVAIRYKSLEGVEPTVRLETEDGGLLMNNDPLSIVIQMGSPLIVARVLSWKIISITSAYQEACQELGTSCDRELLALADSCQATGSILVEDMYLKWPVLAPLMRALTHFQPLHTLSLASNNISDARIKEVAECISKLTLLRSLDLTNTNLTEKGLEKFAECIVGTHSLKKLEELKMGHNHLGDCLRPLAVLLRAANQIRSLALPDVGLKTHSFSSFNHISLDRIETLDLSYNNICREGLTEILGLLESGGLRELNLAGSGPEVVREMGYYLEHKAPPFLRVLDLSYCPFTSDDLELFVRGAKMCRVLEKVYLDGVEEGGNEDLARLTGLPVRELSVCGRDGLLVGELCLHDQMERLSLSSRSPPHQATSSAPYGLYVFAK